MSQPRRLAAIMFTDIVGYTLIMADDEKKAIQILEKNRNIQKLAIEEHHGKWIKEIGDGILASFPTCTDAVLCATTIQSSCKETNEYNLRIGIHLGEVLEENDDIFGDGVNIASRLQTTAPVGAIWISESVHQNVNNQKEITTTLVGERSLKHIREPVRVFEVLSNGVTASVPITTAPATLFPGKSIAVLPFVSMSSDPDQEYFCDGISEEIINILAQLPMLKVPGRTSSFTFKGKNEDLRTIGEKLSVNTILEGSVRKSGDRIRITAQLINVQDGYHIWSEKFDRVLTDIFEVQDEIAAAIVNKLQVTFDGRLAETKKRQQTENLEAYGYYLKGRALAYKRGKYVLEAKSLFEKALEIDHGYALAHAGLADVYTVICYFGLNFPDHIWPLAKRHAELALQFGPDLAESYACNALITLIHEWNFEKANSFFLKALQLNPGYEQARAWYSYFYLSCAMGDHEGALSNLRLEFETHPLSSYAHSILGMTMGNAGLFEEALIEMKKAVELDPQSYFARAYLSCAHALVGDLSSSFKSFETALSMSNNHPWADILLAVTHAMWGDKAKALEIYTELKSRKTYVEATTLAMVAASLDLKEEALDYAWKGLEKHDPYLIFIARRKGSPYGNPLRAIPEFRQIQERIYGKSVSNLP